MDRHAEGYPLAKDWNLDLIEAIHTAGAEALKSNKPVWKLGPARSRSSDSSGVQSNSDGLLSFAC
jgi:hypothetical protein